MIRAPKSREIRAVDGREIDVGDKLLQGVELLLGFAARERERVKRQCVKERVE